MSRIVAFRFYRYLVSLSFCCGWIHYSLSESLGVQKSFQGTPRLAFSTKRQCLFLFEIGNICEFPSECSLHIETSPIGIPFRLSTIKPSIFSIYTQRRRRQRQQKENLRVSSYLMLFKYAIHLMTAVVLAGVGGQHDTLSKETLQNGPETFVSRKLVSSAYFSRHTSRRLLFVAASGMFGFNEGPFWAHCAARLGTTLIFGSPPHRSFQSGKSGLSPIVLQQKKTDLRREKEI